METIAILGTGNVGSTLGRRLAGAGYSIIFGSRQAPSESVTELIGKYPGRIHSSSIADAVQQSEVVLLAAPWNAARGVVESIADWQGKTLIDCTNPINDRFDGLTLGFTISAAEQIAQWARGSRVVKAFNTVSVATMDNPDFDGQAATMMYCGDDVEAKSKTERLVVALGMEAIDAGPLRNARYLEPLAMLYIHLAVHQRMGGHTAFKILRRK